MVHNLNVINLYHECEKNIEVDDGQKKRKNKKKMVCSSWFSMDVDVTQTPLRYNGK